MKRKLFAEPKMEKRNIRIEPEADISVYGNAKLIYCSKCGNAVGAYDIITGDVFYDGHYCNMCGAKITPIMPEENRPVCEAKHENEKRDITHDFHKKRGNTAKEKTQEGESGKIIQILRKIDIESKKTEKKIQKN